MLQAIKEICSLLDLWNRRENTLGRKEGCPVCGSNSVNYLGYCFICRRTTVGIPLCPRCFSDDVMKNGVARTVNGVLKQKYECNKCRKKFRITMNSESTNEA